ncbi:MAG: DUF4097 family beta strand repeat-containing protein [Elusimicrobiota bacterium]
MKGLAVLGAMTLACGAAGGAELEDIHRDFKGAPVKELFFESIPCDARLGASKTGAASVDIVGSDKDEFVWTVELRGSRLEVKQKERRALSRGSSSRCLATIKLPDGASVKAVSVSGGLKISGGLSAVDAESVSGGVDVQRTGAQDAPVRIETVSGDIKLDAAAGDAKVKTVSGSTLLRGLVGSLDFESMSGSLNARWTRLPARAEILVKTASGDAELGLPEGKGVNASLNSMSGGVRNELAFDASAGLTVKADSMSGRLSLLKIGRP